MKIAEGMSITSPHELRGFEEYLTNMPSLSPASKNKYYSIIKGFIHYWNGSTDMLNKFLSEHQHYNYKTALIHYFRWQGNADMVSYLEKIKIKIKQPKPRNIPSYEDFLKVIKTLDKEEYFIAKFMLLTGARCHEVFKIKLEDIDNEGKISFVTKGGKYREVYLVDSFFSELMNYLKNDKGTLLKEFIFYPNSNSKIESKVKTFWKKLNRMSQKTIGRNIQTHDFRRFCGTYLYEKTGDIEYVRRILGHSNINTTIRYAQYVDRERDIKKSKQILSELENL